MAFPVRIPPPYKESLKKRMHAEADRLVVGGSEVSGNRSTVVCCEGQVWWRYDLRVQKRFKMFVEKGRAYSLEPVGMYIRL